MVFKKAAAKKTAKKVDLDHKVSDFKSTVKKEAKIVGEESKIIATGIGKRRHTSTPEEKLFTILGIILLIRGLYRVKDFIRGMLLIIAGILFVTGYFIKKK
jgi:hypothetical protein